MSNASERPASQDSPPPESADELFEAAEKWRQQRGYNVVPQNLHGGKFPAVRWKELQNRRVELSDLQRWLSKNRFLRGVGFITGAISDAVVIDTDGEEGEALLREFEQQHGALPKTLTIRSGSGRGLHRHFKHPGSRVTTRANVEIKIDIKGDGGFCVLPPTLHKSGGRYEVIDDVDLAPLPVGLLDFIEERARAAKGEKPRRSAEVIQLHGLSGRVIASLDKRIDALREADVDLALNATGDDAQALIAALGDARLRIICAFLIDAGVFARQRVTRTQWLALPRMLMKLGVDEKTVWSIWALVYDGDDHNTDTSEALVWVAENGYGLPEFAKIMKAAAQKAGRDDVLSALVELRNEAREAKGGFVSWGGFTMDPHEGLTVEVTKGSGGKNETTVVETVSGPFEVLGKCRDPNGRGWGKLLRFKDADGRVHRRVVSDADLQREPSQLCAALADEGLPIRRQQQAQLVRYLCGVSVKGRVALVRRTGWHEVAGSKVFKLPDETIGECDELVELESAAVGPYEARGSLQDWKDGVGALTSGHLVPMLAISTALSGPLVHLVSAEAPGIHIWGLSSSGKSTAVGGGASVWGSGDDKGEGFSRSWRATDNGLEGLAASASDTCLVLDEIGAARSRDVGAAAYMLGNGTGKTRARQDGSAREAKKWRTPVLSSGEQPMEGKIREERGRVFAGQLVRIVDVSADRGLGFGVFDHAGPEGDAGKLADAIKAAAKRHYGTAGPEFVRRLLARGVEQIAEEAEARIGAFLRDYVRPGASEQVCRVAKRFALTAAAGEMAVSLGILPWEEGAATEAALWAFERWAERRGGVVGLAEERQAIEHVRRLIEQHGDTRFDVIKERSDTTNMQAVLNERPVRDRLGWRKGEGGKREWWVPSETWREEFCNGQDPAFVARTLHKHGMLRRRDDEKHLQRQERLPDGNRISVYVLTAAVLGDAEAGS